MSRVPTSGTQRSSTVWVRRPETVGNREQAAETASCSKMMSTATMSSRPDGLSHEQSDISRDSTMEVPEAHNLLAEMIGIYPDVTIITGTMLS